MLHTPRIPELAQRDRFVRRAVSEGRVLTLADEENASVASQKVAGRTVQLFWSSSIEAGRWAEALAGNTDLQDIPLATFAADICPASPPQRASSAPIGYPIRSRLKSIRAICKSG